MRIDRVGDTLIIDQSVVVRGPEAFITAVDIAIGGIDFPSGFHEGGEATKKYLKAIYKGHGMVGVKMYLDSLLREIIDES